MSVFNPVQLENMEFEGQLDTTLVPVPENEDGYVAVLSKGEFRQAKDKVIYDITWDIDDANVAAITGRDKNTVRQSLFLDMTDHGTLDFGKGKNVGLGRLREALGQNSPKQKWTFGMMQGQVARVFIKHRMDDEGNVYVDVKKVTSLD